MSSIAKKHKAKNSYLYNGGEKPDGTRIKRIQYFTKQERLQAKKRVQKISEEVLPETEE